MLPSPSVAHWGMFFIYKKKLESNLINQNLLPIRNNSGQQPRIFILTFDMVLLKAMVLPIKYITKDRDSFLLLYRFQSIRNYKMVAYDLKLIAKGRSIQSLLLPTVGLRHVLRILVLFKIPFHFAKPGVGGSTTSKIEIISLVRVVYALLRVNMLYRTISQLE